MYFSYSETLHLGFIVQGYSRCKAILIRVQIARTHRQTDIDPCGLSEKENFGSSVFAIIRIQVNISRLWSYLHVFVLFVLTNPKVSTRKTRYHRILLRNSN